MARFLKITEYGNREKSYTYLYRLTNHRSRHFFRISNKGCNSLLRNVRVRIYKFSRPIPNLSIDIKNYRSLVSSLVVRLTLGFWRIEFWKFEFSSYRLKYSRKYWPNYFSCHRFARNLFTVRVNGGIIFHCSFAFQSGVQKKLLQQHGIRYLAQTDSWEVASFITGVS